jgi:hypothetical protein
MTFCLICGAPLGFPFKLLFIGAGIFCACLLALTYMASPYSYIVAVPLAILALVPLGGAGFILYRKIKA